MEDQGTRRTGMRLLKQGQIGLKRVIFSRIGLMSVMVLVQFFAFFSALYWLQDALPYLTLLSGLFTAAMLLYLLNCNIDPTSKITWFALIAVLPLFGAQLLWYTKSDPGHRALRRRLDQTMEDTKTLIPQSPAAMEALERQCPGAAALSRYLQRSGCHQVYMDTAVTYFASGEEKFKELLIELEKAERFIFLEYFIVEEGVMWGSVLEILARKAAQGVDVRVMYDGTCEFLTLPRDYPKRLEALGIKCRVFAPVTPFISTHYNNRDHRKILVIDGRVAFNGGVNLADEYINKKERFGHWKDTAVMLRGEAVRGFTLMFLQMWCLRDRNPEIEPYVLAPIWPPEEAKGFVMPYGDCPLDRDRAGERVYMDLLNRATKYVHIMTPYLILDGVMETALKFAAERGVDVRIILPGIPDKQIPFALAKTHYAALIEAGIKIYEYTPGFVHAKSFVCDGQEAVVGTVNLDYRSLYHHFECGTYMYGVDCIRDIEADFEETLLKCQQVTRQTMRHEKLKYRFLGPLLKVLAPLL